MKRMKINENCSDSCVDFVCTITRHNLKTRFQILKLHLAVTANQIDGLCQLALKNHIMQISESLLKL